MAIKLDKNFKLKIIDKTILEIFLLRPQKKNQTQDFLFFSKMLKSHGVDVFEINKGLALYLKNIPTDIEFMLRVESKDDIQLIEHLKIKKCIVSEKYAEENFLKRLSNQGIFLALEIKYDNEKTIATKIASLHVFFKYINLIRIIEVDKLNSFLWLNKIMRLISKTDIKIDICPSNRLFMGTAIALEVALKKVDYITTTFTGFGGLYGYASFEELLVSLIVLKKSQNNFMLKSLPQAVNHFTKISGDNISRFKPIIGENIFLVESGLHANGILKNPETYELFNPDLVGQKRTFIIGKHSGRSSIMATLKEMDITYNIHEMKNFLNIIRGICIKLKRSLNDYEIAKLYDTLYLKGDLK